MTYDYAIIGGSPVYYRTNSYTYTNDLVYTHTDERGLITTNIYDNLKRLTNSSDSRGAMKYIYTNLSLIQVIDRMGFTNSFGYDQLRRKLAETNALGYYTLYAYCTCGSLDSIRDSGGNYTQFFYNNQGRLTNTVYADGFAETNYMDLLGRVITTTDSAGTSTTNWYNNQGLVIAVSNAFGKVLTTTYDALDRATNSTDVNSVTVAATYDNLDRALTKTYPDNGTEKFGYSFGFSQKTSQTNQLGYVIQYSYDPLNRKTEETNANLEVTLYGYSPAGDLLSLTDGKGQTTTWLDDEFGRNTNKIDAANNLIFVYKYDANNRLTNRWTPAKGATIYAYDPLGRLTNVNYPLTPGISLGYDALNRLTNMVDAVGTTRYSYDAVGQLLTEDGPWAEDSVSYLYSNRLRTRLSLLQANASTWVQTYAYDSAKRLTNTISLAGPFGYSYDAARATQVQRLSLPSGATITNSYDSVARLLSTTLRNGIGTLLNSHSYQVNAANQRTQQVFAAGNYVNYTYDPIGQLKMAKGFEPGGITNRWNEQFGFSYDAAGNLNWRTNNTLLENFGVNNLNELTNNTRSGTLTVIGTTTGAATNVTVNTSNAFLYVDSTFASTNHSVADGANTFTALAKDAYGRSDTSSVLVNLPATNTFAYDLNGNLRTNGLQILDYDDENELVTNRVLGTWKKEYVYDGQRRRRIERGYVWTGTGWTQTNEIHFIYDGYVILQERDGNNNVGMITLTRGLDVSGTMQGAGGIGGLLAMTENAALSPIHSYYHSDGNGNVTCLFSSNDAVIAQYSFDPFGNPTKLCGPKSAGNRYRFSSKPIDTDSGAYDFCSRWLLPNLQRWLNSDPIAEAGGPNLYEFVGNDPIAAVDSFGLAVQVFSLSAGKQWYYSTYWGLGGANGLHVDITAISDGCKVNFASDPVVLPHLSTRAFWHVFSNNSVTKYYDTDRPCPGCGKVQCFTYHQDVTWQNNALLPRPIPRIWHMYQSVAVDFTICADGVGNSASASGSQNGHNLDMFFDLRDF